jgi:hypothetical protein
MTDVVQMMENKIGYKCDEAFLEEAAIRLLRNSFKRNCNNSCQGYKLILADLDDPTIILQRFVTNVKAILADNGNAACRLVACSNRDNERIRQSCEKIDVEFIQKPLNVLNVRHLVDTSQ